MTVVAVTPARGPLAARLLARLGARERISQILAVDLAEPPLPPAKLEVRVADVRDPVLRQALDGADVVVHLGALPGHGQPDGHGQPGERDRRRGGRDDRYTRVVHGTRNVLDAAAAAGVRAVVHASSASVYGAHPDNPVPLPESARLRAPADAPAAYRAALADELVGEFASRHPEVSVARLRFAPLLGEGVEGGAAALLEAPRLLAVSGYEPVVQVLDVDDAAAAIEHVITEGVDGPLNAAADGWVPAEEAAALVGRRPLWLPEAPLGAVLDGLDHLGIGDAAPGQLGYLMHPWVLATERLRASGWHARRSNRDVLRDAGEAHRPFMRLGPLRVRRRSAYTAIGAGAVAGTLLAWRAARRLRRARS